MRFGLALIALSTLVPFASSTVIQTPEKSCKKNEFWWKAKECCLPNGGVVSPPSPPHGSSCPPSGYYWKQDKGCCAPRYPPKDNEPEPQCDKDHQWYKALHQCLPNSHHPPMTTHKPSATPVYPPYPKPTKHHGGEDDHGHGDHGDDHHGDDSHHGDDNHHGDDSHHGGDNDHGNDNGGKGGYGNDNQGRHRRRRDLKPMSF